MMSCLPGDPTCGGEMAKLEETRTFRDHHVPQSER